MPRVLLVLLLSLAALAVGAACGSEASDEASFATPAQVQQRFREATGKPVLRKAPVTDEAWDQLGLGLDPDPALVERYGTFVVYVVKEGRGNAVGSLLRDKGTQRKLEPDDRGIYWELDTLSETWVANKRYAGNVVLAWFSDSGDRRTDARFHRLDRILRGLQTS
jgi:hypothetical protein